MDKTNELSNTLNRVMDMLKYAEAKNTILLTFESGLLYVVFTEYLDEIVKYPVYLLWISPLLVSFMFLILSFLPKLSKSDSIKNTNIQFYGDISKIDVDEYNRIFVDKINKIEDFNADLVAQIHYNSQLTNKKFRAFKLAIWFLFVVPIAIKLLMLICSKIAKLIDEV